MKKIILFILLCSLQVKAQSLDQETKRAIKKAAKAFKVPELELLKIAFVESTLRKNPPARYNKNKTYDVGMFQINSVHWHTTCKEFDVSKVDGNAMCAAKFLAQHLSHSKTDPHWVARYHSKTPKHKLKYSEKLSQAETFLTSKQIALN